VQCCRTLPEVAEILTVTNRELFVKTENEYRDIAGTSHKDKSNKFILEPFGRNTAPAMLIYKLPLLCTPEKFSRG
jgi:mannose-1-phosphate guanylyltransferase/mannose-6-phosphate isomerase